MQENTLKIAVNGITASLVVDFLQNHGQDHIARQLKKCLQINLPNLQGLTLATFYNHYNLEHETRMSSDERKVVPIRTKRALIVRLCDSVVVKYLKEYGFESIANYFLQILEVENLSTELELSNIVENFNILSPKENTDDLLNEWTTVLEAYGDKRDAIDVLDDGKFEAAKVLKYILDKDIPIQKIYVATAIVSFRETNGLLYVTKKGRTQFPMIKYGYFSAARCGELSDECCILRAWEELVQDVPILNPKQCMFDIQELKTHRWPLGLIGCYLAKFLSAPRYAIKVFEFACARILYQVGKFDKAEDEIIFDYVKGNIEPNFDELSERLRRTRFDVERRLDRLTQTQNIKMIYTKYSLLEDQIIMQHVFANGIPKTVEDVLNVKGRNWELLVTKLERFSNSIRNRWGTYIKPTIVAYLNGKLNDQTWQKDFVQFVIDRKAVSSLDIPWDLVLVKWPHCTRYLMSKFLTTKTFDCNKALPLFERLRNNIHKLDGRSAVRQEFWQLHKQALVDVFEDFRGVKPMSEQTRQKLKNMSTLDKFKSVCK
jgi:predicted transcriptional regulator